MLSVNEQPLLKMALINKNKHNGFQYHLSKRYSPLIHLWSLTIRLCRGLGDKRSTLWGIIVSIVLQSIKEKRK